MANKYEDALAALRQNAEVWKIRPLLMALADSPGGIDNHADKFGLTITMHAAALGNLEAVKAAHALGSLLHVRNRQTNANLLHYAAQALQGGAEIIKWAILKTGAPVELLTQRVLMEGEIWDKGHGHTVAMEAAFFKNTRVLRALLELQSLGHDVDFTTPAVTGFTPLDWAFALGENEFASLLLRNDCRSWDCVKSELESKRKQYVEKADDAWLEKHPEDEGGIDLANELRNYVVNGGEKESIVARLDPATLAGADICVNKPYGRLGQPLLILVPTHPSMMIDDPTDDQKSRYSEIVDLLIEKAKAKPDTPEKGLMAVSAGFREVFFGYAAALARMIEGAPVGFVDEQGMMNGYTRLLDAVLSFKKGRPEIVQLLVKHGGNPDIIAFDGQTARTASEAARKKGLEIPGFPQKSTSSAG